MICSSNKMIFFIISSNKFQQSIADNVLKDNSFGILLKKPKSATLIPEQLVWHGLELYYTWKSSCRYFGFGKEEPMRYS